MMGAVLPVLLWRLVMRPDNEAVPVWTLGAVSLGVALVGLIAYLLTARRIEKAHEVGRQRQRALAEALTMGRETVIVIRDGTAYGMNAHGLLEMTSDDAVEPDRVRKLLESAGEGSVVRAFDSLRENGTRFEASIDLPVRGSSRHFAVKGCRVEGELPASDVLWLRDITDEHDAACRNDELLTRLDAVLDSLPIPIWIRDKDLQLIDVNAAFVQAVDAPDKAAVLADQREFAASAVAEKGRHLAREARDMGTSLSQRHHVVMDGERRFLEITELPLPGLPILLGFAVDLNEFDEARAELRRHTAAQQDVLERLATAVAIYGADRRLKFFNSAFLNLWGLDGDFLHGEPTLGEVLEALRERRRLPEITDFQSWKHAQERQIMTLIDPVENLLHLPDGRTLRTLTTPHPLGGLLFLYEDVTDRLALERSYNTLIAVQRETLDNLYEGVAVIGSDGRVKLYNPSFARIWEVPENFLGQSPHVRDLVGRSRHLLDADDWDAFVDRVVSRVTDRRFHKGRLERLDGKVFDYAFVPLPDGGSLLSYTDSTDSHRIQRALREQAEALEATDRLKTEFLTNVSYALRTPLNTIIGFTEILEKGFYGALNERQHEYIGGILESSHALLTLINNILDLAMIEAGRMTLHRGPVDVRTMLADVAEIGDQWARQQDLQLKMDCPDTLPAIDADERRVKQALINLISNAITFTPAGGRIRIGAGASAGGVAISVSDSGVGIADGDRRRVFEKFERGTAADVQTQGVGLGLALVKQIIELHGGRVELDSTVDKGTTVTLHLPLAAAPVEVAAAGD